MFGHDIFTVKTWASDEKPVKKIVLFPERDIQGEIFYKIEGQFNMDCFMINYYYDRAKAITEYNSLLMKFIEFQERNLIHD